MADVYPIITFAIYNQLKVSPNVTALVGNRIYPQRLPPTMTVWPALTYVGVSNVPQYTHDGQSGIRVARVQISSWSTDYAQAKRCAAQVGGALEAFRGSIPTSDGLLGIGSIMLINEIDQLEPDTSLHHIAQDFKVEAQR